MMKGALGSPVGAAMQESFGCAVANRFHQLLDDESDPFDILREAERRQQQRKKRDEAASSAAAATTTTRKPGPGQRPGPAAAAATAAAAAAAAAKRESQKERKGSQFLQPESSPAPGAPPQPGQKRAPKRGEQQGWNENRGTERKQDKAEWKPSFREYRSYEMERQVEFAVEKPIDRSDRERSMRGRGGGRGGVRGRGAGMNRSFNGFDQRGKREFERQSGSDKTGIRAEDKRGGSGAHNWGTVKDDLSELEQTAPMEETVETEEHQGTTEGESLTNSRMAEGEPVEEVVQEMTLDEWKNLQQQNRPKPEFNIRKPETTVPSKAVVIHKSKYRDDILKGDFDDDSHIFRKSVNDITSQLDINFGNLPRPGRGARGARGGRGRVKRVEDTGPKPEVVTHIVAPNPDDPEDFPALA